MMGLFPSVLIGIERVVLVYFAVLSGVSLLTSALAYRKLLAGMGRLKTIDWQWLLTSSGAPGISLFLPCFNEESTCVESVRGAMGLRYPNYEIVVINDGSTDRTLDVLTEALDLVSAARPDFSEVPSQTVRGWYRSRTFSKVWVLDKVNGGKADALNAALRSCANPYFCTVDADTLLEPEALIRLIRPLLEDASTIAAGGHVRVINGCTVTRGQLTAVRMPGRWLERFQALEYLRGFLQGRIGWTSLGAPMIIAGAFSLFRRSLVVAAGGFNPTVVCEDMELVVRLHRYCGDRGIPYRIAFVPEAVVWTRCPTRLRHLISQRDRWQRGLAEVIWRHRGMFARFRYGRVGLLSYPYFVLFEFGGPFIEMFGYAAFIAAVFLGWLHAGFAALFALMVFGFGACLSFLAIFFEEFSLHRYRSWRDLLRLFIVAVVEPFIYRPFVTGCRINGSLRFLMGLHGWGKWRRSHQETSGG